MKAKIVRALIMINEDGIYLINTRTPLSKVFIMFSSSTRLF